MSPAQTLYLLGFLHFRPIPTAHVPKRPFAVPKCAPRGNGDWMACGVFRRGGVCCMPSSVRRDSMAVFGGFSAGYGLR